MAAPTPTARATPAGRMLGDGHGTRITLALDTNIEFDEDEVTPPSFKADPPIDRTSNSNVRVRTYSPPLLFMVGPVKASVFYDPLVEAAIVAAICRHDTVTVTFSNGDTWCAFAYLEEFTPGSLRRGDKVKADVTIFITNFDPVNCVEALPVYTAGAGTAC